MLLFWAKRSILDRILCKKNSYEPYLILEALCILGTPVRSHSPHGPKNAPALFNPGSNHVLGLFVIFSGIYIYATLLCRRGFS